MAHTLEGSCHCGAVRFRFECHTPYPFNYCYCSVCRKTTGAGGFAINIMGDVATLEVEGRENLAVYHAVIDGAESGAERNFCARCGSHLWLYDARWPDLFHPLAAAIDTELPAAPERVHLMLEFKPGWVPVPPEGPADRHFDGYPEESIEAWHRARGLYED